MKINFKGRYKSLSSFNCELNGLTVITGKNGTGKTQFLELLELKRVGNIHLDLELEPVIDSRDIQNEGLDRLNSSLMNREGWQGAIDQLRNLMNGTNGSFWDLIDIVQEQKLDIDNLKSSDLLKLFTKEEEAIDFLDAVYYDMYSKRNAISTNYYSEDPDNSFTQNCNDLINELQKRRNSIELYSLAAKRVQKKLRDLQYDDFGNLPVNPKLISKANLFYSSAEEIMYNHYKQRHDNLYLQFLEHAFHENNGSISDTEFVNQNPPPEGKINELFEKHDIPYFIKSIDVRFFTWTGSYGFWFTNKHTGEEVRFESLSSGEKIIIGIILKVFNAFYFSNKLTYPKLLILDEPDAFLHPQMSKLLVEVLQDSFVKEFGMDVIMTTHSPSTVAVAPEESLYVISNYKETLIRKTTKDDALKILTDTIPTLSIDYKNHRQVFVESDNDRSFYQTIYNKHLVEAKLPHKLYFISYPSGNGNCDAVIQTVNALNDAGNNTCYGIVDWDLKRSGTNRILVHGEGCRYSIENYLYDPIYLVALFIKDNGANGIYKELNFSSSYDEHDIGSESNEKLQEMANWFFEKIKNKYLNIETSKDLVAVNYLNGKTIQYPQWYLSHNGHDLLVKLKNVFPSLDNRKVDDNALFKKLTDLIAKCYPFVSEDTIAILNALGK